MSGEFDQVPATVLFVDDEENILRAVSRLFMDEPYQVVTASSGARGLELLAATPDVALIVSDQRMPEMDGVEFLERSREIAPEAVRMVLTGYADMTATIDAINRGGANRYLTKPWEDDALVHAVREAVHTYRLSRENRRLLALVEKQNLELQEWNRGLKDRVLEQTTRIRLQNEGLRNANENLSGTLTEVIAAFSSLLALREPGMQDHGRVVAGLSLGIARAAGVHPDDLENIKTAALLHDIGKIGVNDSLLHKGLDILRPEEREEYMLHSVRGQAALDGVVALRPAALLIRHHHEHFDGTGGPDRLKGDDIPLGARIIAVADSLDWLVNTAEEDDPVAAALEKVAALAGTMFDPMLMRCLEKPARAAYANLAVRLAAREVEVAPDELLCGMTVSRDITSGTGLLLLNRGAVLSETMIEAIKRYYSLDPPGHGVHIWSEG